MSANVTGGTAGFNTERVSATSVVSALIGSVALTTTCTGEINQPLGVIDKAEVKVMIVTGGRISSSLTAIVTVATSDDATASLARKVNRSVPTKLVSGV